MPAAARSALLLARDPADPLGERGNQRVLAHFTCNLATLAPSLSYRVEPTALLATTSADTNTAQLVELGPTDQTARELLQPYEGREPSARQGDRVPPGRTRRRSYVRPRD